MANDKHIVVIRTPVSSKSFTQVTTLMNDDELRTAKLERPDLDFTVISPEKYQNMEDPVEVKEEEVKLEAIDEKKGISVHGMTLPYDLDDQIGKLLGDK